MSNKLITLVVVVFILIIAGMFGFAYLKKAEAPATTPVAATSTASVTNPYGITRIEAKHFFRKGVHTIVGELSLPTPCDLLTSTSSVATVPVPLVMFDFSAINNSATCIQKITTARFMVSGTAGSDAQLKARFMGAPVELNLVEAAAGETPENYELYIKG